MPLLDDGFAEACRLSGEGIEVGREDWRASPGCVTRGDTAIATSKEIKKTRSVKTRQPCARLPSSNSLIVVGTTLDQRQGFKSATSLVISTISAGWLF